MSFIHKIFLILFIYGLSLNSALSDVVKPALVEINVHTNSKVNIEVRASIEALLTGINAQYKNTKDAPTADDYDVLRAMSPDELEKQFNTFHQDMLDSLFLKTEAGKVFLSVTSVNIPEPGYTKVPRISIIKLSGQILPSARELQWYYPARFGDNAVRLRQIDEANEQWHWSEWQWLRKDQASELFSMQEIFAKRSLTAVIGSYIAVGFEHIIPKGTDHLLFILGIFLLSVRLKPLLWQVTMFTLAHTITLGLSMNGVISLPANIVEPLIALSIAYIGIENIVHKSLHKSRLVLVFLFGLLHGLGFAGVLADFGMPDDDFAIALISFNVGVELAQLSVIAVAFAAVGFWFCHKHWYRKMVIIPGSVLISITGLLWTIQRIQ
ncbi:MAG: HupE/UreJ family protein [Gammaproteobacteria bacterium]|nr:HupE/UreJ family protein [Gammaproteobacteria bacterium]